MPNVDEGEVEYRVCYIHKNSIAKTPQINELREGWYRGTPDDAAVHPWLMKRCIVWVEERLVIKTPWEPSADLAAT